MDTLQKLYDSEINAGLWWNWDGGIEVRLGNGLYGDEKNWTHQDNVKTMEDAEKWFIDMAKQEYPRSTFVKNLPNYTMPMLDGIEDSLASLSIRGK